MSKIVKVPDARPLIKTPQELVHIKHKISLRQYKYWLLMLRAYREVYEFQGAPNEQGFYRLPISTLEEWLGYELVRSELRTDLEAIRREPIIYNVLGKDGKKILRGAGFISEWELSANWVGFKLPGFLRESIEQLDLKSSIFQKINWEVFNSFTGKYEAVLYKLCRDYMGSKRTPQISIQDYREYMGLKDGEYALFKDLNKFVITTPIKRINESAASDITIEAVFTREERKVVRVQFLITPKQQTMLDFGDDPAFRFSKVTILLSKQREYLASKSAPLIESSIQRANEYGEEQEKQGKTVNYGAIYRKAIEEDWGKDFDSRKVRESALVQVINKQQADEQQKKITDFKEEYRKLLLLAAIKALTLEERHTYAMVWLQTEKGSGQDHDYVPEVGDFKTTKNKLNFNQVYLRQSITVPVDEPGFTAWLQKEKGISLKQQDAKK